MREHYYLQNDINYCTNINYMAVNAYMNANRILEFWTECKNTFTKKHTKCLIPQQQKVITYSILNSYYPSC